VCYGAFLQGLKNRPIEGYRSLLTQRRAASFRCEIGSMTWSTTSPCTSLLCVIWHSSRCICHVLILQLMRCPRIWFQIITERPENFENSSTGLYDKKSTTWWILRSSSRISRVLNLTHCPFLYYICFFLPSWRTLVRCIALYSVPLLFKVEITLSQRAATQNVEF
jgi:hypothetical protein